MRLLPTVTLKMPMAKAAAWGLLARPGMQVAAIGQLGACASTAGAIPNTSKTATMPEAMRDPKRKGEFIRYFKGIILVFRQ